MRSSFTFFSELPLELKQVITDYALNDLRNVSKELEELRRTSPRWRYYLKIEFPYRYASKRNFYAQYKKIFKEEYAAYTVKEKKLLTILKHGDAYLFESQFENLEFKLSYFYLRDKSHHEWLYWFQRANNQKLYDLVFEKIIRPYFINNPENKKDEGGTSYLHWASLCNQVDSLKDYFSKNNQLKILYDQDELGVSLINYICNQREQSLLDCIYQKIVKPYFQTYKEDPVGMNILHWAVRCNRSKKEILGLIKNGTNVNSKSRNETTPLFLAVQHNYPELVKILLEQGANPNIIRKDLCSALYYAAERNYLEVTKLLVRSGKLESLNPMYLPPHKEQERNPVFRAMENNSLEVMEFLLENKETDVTLKIEKGKTMLWLAVSQNRPDILRILLKHRPDLDWNEPIAEGDTPLSLAKKSDSKEIRKLAKKYVEKEKSSALVLK